MKPASFANSLSMYNIGLVPYGMTDFGTVMMPKPEEPFSPVTVKVTAVDVSDWFAAIVRFDIWELVIFPLISRSTVVPLSIVAGTVVAGGVACVGVGAGEGFCVGFKVGIGGRTEDWVGSGVGKGVGVGVGVSVGSGVGVGEGVGVGVWEGDGIGV